jgi:hypothetical protein
MRKLAASGMLGAAMRTFVSATLLLGLLAFGGASSVQAQTQAQPLDDNMFSVMSKAGGEAPVRQEPVDTDCDRPPCPSNYYDPYLYYYGGFAPTNEPDLNSMTPAERRAYLEELERRRKAGAAARRRAAHPRVQTGLSE